MQFVMVPVPEEHAGEVVRFVDRLRSRTLREPWDATSVLEFLGGCDEPSVALLSMIASATLGGRQVGYAEAAQALDIAAADLDLVLFVLTMRSNGARREHLIDLPREAPQEVLGAEVSERRFVIDRNVAELVVASMKRIGAFSDGATPSDRGTRGAGEP